METIEHLTTPPAPHAELQFGTVENAQPTTEENMRLLAEKLGPIAYMRQVHGDNIRYAAKPGVYEEADALFTDRQDIWLAVSTADCLPLLVSSPDAVAAIHAGWRGLRQGIVEKTIHKLREEFAMDVDKLFLSVGPCIRQNNYEVSDDFTAYFDEKFFRPSERKNHLKLDLPAVARQQAIQAGMLEMNIFDSDVDTYADKRFFSYRRSKKEGHDVNVQPSLIRRKPQKPVF